MKVKTNGNVRMDYMISQDKKFVAAQLFRFIPYTYEPASSVFYFTGDDASAFVHCLETSEFDFYDSLCYEIRCACEGLLYLLKTLM